jgi:hypothetical protein
VKTVKDYILFALLVVGVAVVALMYSPVGSPQLYHDTDRIGIVSSVQFYGKIENAPRQSATSAHAHTPFDNAMLPTSTISFGSSSPSNSLGSASGNHSSLYALGISHTDYTLKSSGGGGGGADMAFSSGGTRDNENGQGISLGGFSMPHSSSSSSFASSSPFSPKIAAPYATNEGGMDPGADPTSEPLPLNEDVMWWLVCAVGYIAIKKYNFLLRWK